MTVYEAFSRTYLACAEAWTDNRWTHHIRTPEYDRYATSYIFLRTHERN